MREMRQQGILTLISSSFAPDCRVIGKLGQRGGGHRVSIDEQKGSYRFAFLPHQPYLPYQPYPPNLPEFTRRGRGDV